MGSEYGFSCLGNGNVERHDLIVLLLAESKRWVTKGSK